MHRELHADILGIVMWLVRFPMLGLVRIQPLRTVRRAWLWVTAPDTSRTLVTCPTRDDLVQIRDLTDSELWGLCFRSASTGYIEREMKRRGIREVPVPQWAKSVDKFWPNPELMQLAEKLLRPAHL